MTTTTTTTTKNQKGRNKHKSKVAPWGLGAGVHFMTSAGGYTVGARILDLSAVKDRPTPDLSFRNAS